MAHTVQHQPLRTQQSGSLAAAEQSKSHSRELFVPSAVRYSGLCSAATVQRCDGRRRKGGRAWRLWLILLGVQEHQRYAEQPQSLRSRTQLTGFFLCLTCMHSILQTKCLAAEWVSKVLTAQFRPYGAIADCFSGGLQCRGSVGTQREFVDFCFILYRYWLYLEILVC